LIGLHHGNGAKEEQLPMIMATDVPDLWASTQYREWHTGHLHTSNSKGFTIHSEKPGVKVTRVPALSPASDWTAVKGYRSEREAMAFLWHESKGKVATFHYKPE
jgi:hypothetical protein